MNFKSAPFRGKEALETLHPGRYVVCATVKTQRRANNRVIQVIMAAPQPTLYKHYVDVVTSCPASETTLNDTVALTIRSDHVRFCSAIPAAGKDKVEGPLRQHTSAQGHPF